MTITRLTARPVLAPLPRPITTAVMSIEKAPLILVDIENSSGIIGQAYLFTYTPMALAPLVKLLENIGRTLIGKPAAPVARMAEMEASYRLLGRQGLVAMALAGIDMALWDIAGKAAGLGVVEVLGGTAAPVPCYDSHGVFQPGRDEGLIEASLAAGFRAIKIKIGGGSVAADIAALGSIRRITGPDVALMADYNQSLSAPEAIRRILAIEDAGLDLAWIEEPVAAEDYAGHRAVRAAVTTAIQTGENWWMPDDAARAAQAEISDHAMLDIMKIGGLTGWQRAASIAAAASLPVSSHLFVEASAHALALTPNAHLLEYLDVAAAVLADPYRIEDGTLTPRGPGFGIAWDETAVAAHAFTG